MKCWNCGGENPVGVQYCNTCAAPQSQEAYEASQRVFAAQRQDSIVNLYLFYVKMGLFFMLIYVAIVIIVFHFILP